MSLDAKKAYALSKKYTDETVIGGGAIKGKNCTIESIEPISGGQRVTFKWTLDDGTEQTTTMDVMDGVDGQDGKGIKSVAINEESHLIITYTDDTTYDAGAIEVHSAVDSVNGKTGTVVLDADDIGAVAKETGKGLSKNDYTDADKDIVDGVTTALNGKVDKETGKSLIDLTTVVDGASYDSTNHLILFKHGSTTLFSLDAAAFVKDGMVDTVTITGGNLVITFNTDAGKQDISIPITDIFDPANYYDKDDVDGLLADKADETEVADIVNVYGAKNLLPYPYYNTTKTQNGVTFTDNGDGTVTVNGTATDGVVFFCSIRGENGKCILPNGKYIVTGCPNGGAAGSYKIGASRITGGSGTTYGMDVGNGLTITLDGDDFGDDDVRLQIGIAVSEGTVCNNLVFKPMVRLASVKDDTYVPHAKTNRELTIDSAEQKAEVDDIVNVYGSKNLLRFPYSYSTITIAGITYTVKDDGTIIANGTATDASIFRCSIRKIEGYDGDFFIKNGKYILSGCIGGSAVLPYTYDLRCVITKNNEAVALAINGDGDTPFTVNGDDFSQDGAYPTIQIIIRSGITVTNKVFKPMIRLASVKDNTYVPYAKTNHELTVDKAEQTAVNDIVNVYGAKNLLPYPCNGTTQTVAGVTYTDNGDGTFTANGEATALSDLVLYTRGVAGFPLKAGTYTLSGAPEGSAADTYCIYVRGTGSSATSYIDYGSGVTFTLDTDEANMGIYLRVKGGVTVSDLTYKPMIRMASVKDDTYTPYVMTNKELTKDMMYSTSEIVTGKKWIDGKPIYRKVIDIGTLPNTTTKSVDHGITNFDLCISLVGVVRNSTSRLTIPSVWNDATETIGIYANGTSVIVSTSKDRSSFSGYAIIEYTKSV